MIIEIYRWIQYIILYIYKVFYEVILFFDEATIYKIIRSRILGFMMVTIGYIIMGVNFFIIYIWSWIIGFFIYTGVHIYINYKKIKKKNYDIENLENILILFGYINYIVLIYTQIEDLEKKIRLFIYPIKFRKNFYYDAVKRKYGAKEATKCITTVVSVITVRKDNLIYINKNEAFQKGIEYIYISKGKFFTDFHLKRIWYVVENSFFKNKMEDSFVNTILLVEQLPNIFYFHLNFVFEILMCFTINEDKINEINEKECKKKFDLFWNQETKQGKYYLGYLNQFFEFKDIYVFIKLMEEKKNEIGYEGFKKRLEEINYFEINNNICEMFRQKIIDFNEFSFLKFEIIIEFMRVLNIKYDKNYYKQLCKFIFKEDYEDYKEKVLKKITR